MRVLFARRCSRAVKCLRPSLEVLTQETFHSKWGSSDNVIHLLPGVVIRRSYCWVISKFMIKTLPCIHFLIRHSSTVTRADKAQPSEIVWNIGEIADESIWSLAFHSHGACICTVGFPLTAASWLALEVFSEGAGDIGKCRLKLCHPPRAFRSNQLR